MTALLMPPRLDAVEFRALGVNVRLVVSDASVLAAAHDLLREGLDALDLACSRFRSDSELSRLNDADGRITQVSPLFARAIDVALHAAERTDGDVDPTLGRSLVRLGYDRDFDSLAADAPPVAVQFHRSSHWTQVTLDRERCTVQLPPGVHLDLGATAKALGADLAAQGISTELNIGVLVSVGGDIACGGPAPAGGWAIRVQDRPSPLDEEPAGPSATVSIAGGGLATSSTAARRWRRGGDVMHHLVDPRTGMSVDTPWRTVSVHAASCVDANIATTATMIRGESGVSWLRSIAAPARLVDTAGTVRCINGWPIEESR